MNRTVYDIERFVGDCVTYMAVNGIRQKDLCEAVNMTPSKISRILNGMTTRIDQGTLSSIANATGLLLDNYIIGSGIMVNLDTINLDTIDLNSLTVEEIDDIIHKLKVIRMRKLNDELAAIKNRELAIMELMKEEI